MRSAINKSRQKNDRINYRGENGTRLDALTDTVFGIAITLLIFNQDNPDSFQGLINFTKTLPAFALSIGFLVIMWYEHVNFARIYALRDSLTVFLHAIFLALVIFYVYPLRFLTVFLTNIFFGTGFMLNISGADIPQLMIYYGFIAFGLYFCILLFYWRALAKKEELELDPYECFFTRMQVRRGIMMCVVPLISILLVVIVKGTSRNLAGFVGGMAYFLFNPAIFLWVRHFRKTEKKVLSEIAEAEATEETSKAPAT